MEKLPGQHQRCLNCPLFNGSLGLFKVIPAGWCCGEYLCNASCCRAHVACSQANRADVCSKPSASRSSISSFMLGQRFNHMPWEGRHYTVLLCRWESGIVLLPENMVTKFEIMAEKWQ